MDDKRSAKRVRLDHPVDLVIEGDAVRGTLVDLSTTGALFAFEGDSRSEVDPSVLGLDGSFTIKPKDKPARLYTGEMVRFYVRDERSFVALRFWARFKEIEG